MNDPRVCLRKKHSWSTCSAELPHRTLDDVRRTVFVLPSMHLVIPLPSTPAKDVPSGPAYEQELPEASAYQWANSETAPLSMRWRNAGSNPPLMRTRFISPEPETR